MRKGMLLLSLLLLACISHAQLNVTEFTIPYLYKGENYSRDVRVLSSTLSSGNYSVVIINNTYTFLLNISDRIYFVENQQQIDSLLREFYSKTVYPTKVELDALNSSFQSFLSSRWSELDCKVITGLVDPNNVPRFTCTSENMCQSCQAVPVCRAYMFATVTSPDLMSSPLAKAIARMDYDISIINTNVTKFNDNIANLSSDISQSLSSIKESLTAIKSAVDDIGKPPVSKLYEQYAATHSRDALDFCLDFHKNYNMTALNSAISKATELTSRVPTENATVQQVSSIFNSTPERKLNRTRREEREAFNLFYTGLLERRSNITEKASIVLSHIKDNETANQLKLLDDMLDDIRELGDNRNYGGADLLSKNFSLTADTLDTHLSQLTITYNELLGRNESASDALFSAWLRVGPEDLLTRSRLDDLYTQKASIEFTIYNNSPMSLSETNNMSDELLAIQLNADAISEEKASASSQQMNNLIAVIAKPLISFSLGLIDPLMPLSYADKERNAPTIMGVMLLLFDIFILVICIGAFLLFVRSRRIELHRLAKILWAFIFTFVVLLLALGSLAVYNVVDMQSHPTTYDAFLSELKASTKVGVVAELTGMNETMKERISNCSERIASKLGSLQKYVMLYRYDGENCLAGNMTQSRTSCESDIDANPVIVLQSGEENKATFRVLYTKKALFEGDEKFFSDCMISKVLG